jgi:hypothetical protein
LPNHDTIKPRNEGALAKQQVSVPTLGKPAYFPRGSQMGFVDFVFLMQLIESSMFTRQRELQKDAVFQSHSEEL